MTAATDYVDIDTARNTRGLRLVLTRGVPGPWGESAKGILWVKRIPYSRVAQEAGGANEALIAWTGRADAPIAMYDDEPPRSGWIDILRLAERIAPEPALIPEDPHLRARMFGYANELCGEHGFGWSRRLMMIDRMLPRDGDPLRGEGPMQTLGRRHGYSRAAAAKAPARVAAILSALSAVLSEQYAAGRPFFVGDRLSALDIYWAAFAALLEPLPSDLCPTPDYIRPLYVLDDPELRSTAAPLLAEHRDRVYREYLELPVRL
ncbi:MAG TPA: glutathione binding-like protein [Candidatus Binatia bacterium]|nr:glutathione binding-like protein [Candidatus Binatia bacterium]